MTALVARKKQKSVAVLYGNRSEYPSQHEKKTQWPCLIWINFIYSTSRSLESTPGVTITSLHLLRFLILSSCILDPCRPPSPYLPEAFQHCLAIWWGTTDYFSQHNTSHRVKYPYFHVPDPTVTIYMNTQFYVWQEDSSINIIRRNKKKKP